MSYFQRIKKVIGGILMLLFALILLLVPEGGYSVIATVISFSLLIYGFRLLIYYLTMARHMVGGESSLCQAVIILDLALFTFSMASMSSLYIILYLLGIYAFTGVIDILRAAEARRYGGSWRLKLTVGVVGVLFSILLLIIGIVFGKTDILVYGYSLSLIYSGVMRIITAFRRTAIVYIQ